MLRPSAGAQPFEPAAGSLLCGRYRLGAEIGRGGFGTVHQAFDLTTSRQVAVKLLIWHASAEDASYKRFVREAELVARIRHPNVVELIDWGQTEQAQPYIVFELLEGRPLSRELKERGALGSRRTADIARQILWALGEAHAAGVVHRDIKPPNIFLCAGSAEDRVKVLDFGIAKALHGEEAAATQLTATGQMLGTPYYMSPEQVRGEAIDASTDLYALGLMLAEMLSGRRVVSGASDIDLLMAHVSPEPFALGPAVTESALYPVIERAVRKQREQRFASAGEMLAALDQALGAPLDTRAPTSVPHLLSPAPPAQTTPSGSAVPAWTPAPTAPFGSGGAPGTLPAVSRAQSPNGSPSRAPLVVSVVLGAVAAMTVMLGILWFLVGTTPRGRLAGSGAPGGAVGGDSDKLPTWDGKNAFVCTSGVHRMKGRKLVLGPSSALSAVGTCELQLVDVELQGTKAIIAMTGKAKLSMTGGSLTASEVPLSIMEDGAAVLTGTRIRGQSIILGTTGEVSLDGVEIDADSVGVVAMSSARVTVKRGTIRGKLFSVQALSHAKITLRGTTLVGRVLEDGAGEVVQLP